MSQEAKKEKIFKSFDDFTNLYELQKTLRFELKPIWNTPKMLSDGNPSVIKQDKVRREKYEAVKPWFDLLHREFIEDALREFKFNNLKEYFSVLQDWQKDKKSKRKKDELIKVESALRKEIVDYFEKTANMWVNSEQYKSLGLKKEGIDILFEAGVFKLLKERFKNEKDTFVNGNNIFDDWDKWTGYFKKFFETRKNFYKSDDTSTAIAYRIVNQNLRRFCDNIQIFQKTVEKIDISEVEKNFKVSCKEIFSLGYYSECILQSGIDKYNKILGGELREANKKIQGINELINKFRQDNPKEKATFLKILDKQIHSEKEPFLESIKTDQELIGKLKIFYTEANKKIGNFKKLIEDFAKDHSPYNLDKIYLSKEAIIRNASRWFENYTFFEQDLFVIVAEKQNKQEYELLRTHKNDSKINNKDGKLSFPDFIKCSHVQQALKRQKGNIWKDKYYKENGGIIDVENPRDIFVQFLFIFQFEIQGQLSHEKIDAETGKKIRVGYNIFADEIKKIIASEPVVGQKEKISIKNFADSTKTIYQMAKYFATEKRRVWLDNYDLDDRFYISSDLGYFVNFYQDAFEQIVRPYDLFRNYLTQKPYDTNKWVLNFENPTLADGWDRNKEQQNSAIIFEKDGYFLLGIMRKGNTNLFVDESIFNKKNVNGDIYNKMVYKYFPNPSQMIPKCSTQLNKVKKHFEKSTNDYILYDENFVKPLIISKEIYELNNYEYQKSYLQIVNGGNLEKEKRRKADSKRTNQIKVFQKEFLELSKNEHVYREALISWINFCKSFLKSYNSTATSGFDYSHIKDSNSYDSVDKFYRDVERGSYRLSWAPVSEAYLNEKNREGKLFLFEIYNKDWGGGPKDKNRKRTKNLHTLYWENLFSKDNFHRNFPFKLNGGAELFFRPATKKEKLQYKLKNSKTGRWEIIKIDKNGILPAGAIVNHKRYSKNKIFFHCPIALNRISKNKTKYEVDAEARKLICDNLNVSIIGVDRGEKNLAYYSLIDRNGKILGAGSLDAIGQDSKGNPVQYAAKLEKRAKEREVSRQEWGEVETIKDLKQGYISQVIKKVVDLAIKHNAIIVFEDLSMRFKQIRGGIEKSIYQQLEKALIDKLSFFVKKDEKNSVRAGHILNAYQLAAPITAFKEMGKQTGIVFYTQASYTSKTCPECGYRRNIKCRFENIKQAEEFLKNLEFIKYDSMKDEFKIGYSLEKMSSGKQNKNKKSDNELYKAIPMQNDFILHMDNGLRYKWYDRYSEKAKMVQRGIKDFRGEVEKSETKKGVVKEFNLTEYIKGLLESVNINYRCNNIQERILSIRQEKQFYQYFIFALYLLTETRQSVSGTSVDYIHCPQCGFDSRNGFQGIKDFSGDANGAYNIARKGIMVLEKIKQFKEKNEDLGKMSWVDLSISLDEWDKFSQKGWQEK